MTADLFGDIPAVVRLKKELDLPAPASEPELLSELLTLSRKNRTGAMDLGAGSYDHFIPSAVKHIVGRSEFYTAYTPYQAEASQGTLQAIYEYQSLICALTGMDVANASMYDGATALAEAAFLACRATGRDKLIVSSAVHPEHRRVLRTYCRSAGIKVSELPFDNKSGTTPANDKVFSGSACYILQQPNFFGCIEPVAGLADKIHKEGALFIVSADPVSLGILTPPGEYGADVAVGEGQSLGNAMNFGGPGLGIFAVKKALLRQIPGRLVGRTIDLDGKAGFTLTLQAREQHIRRDRAASNICSNEALCALAACAYLSLLGRQGLRRAAELCLVRSSELKKRLGSVFSAPTFKEFATSADAGIPLWRFYPELKGFSLVCATEMSGIKA
ncbi:MAG TPA: aminomethyl-transferring glycine dehydrogenase subunit GcvPA [Candidatus Omnitrophota bacterium]|nr:aminomethyl-transferring glycine dehydrogenase subunit GcvPA [Candidatus Omnitrophota bacterium]